MATLFKNKVIKTNKKKKIKMAKATKNKDMYAPFLFVLHFETAS